MRLTSRPLNARWRLRPSRKAKSAVLCRTLSTNAGCLDIALSSPRGQVCQETNEASF